MRKAVLGIFVFVLTMPVLIAYPTLAAGAGAKFVKPVALAIDGGSCETDGKGTVGANFLGELAFDIGPGTVGGKMLGMNMAPYKGPGTYRKVIISAYIPKQHAFMALGTVVVNADRHSGTFDNGKASGTWDCGTALH